MKHSGTILKAPKIPCVENSWLSLQNSMIFCHVDRKLEKYSVCKSTRPDWIGSRVAILKDSGNDQYDIPGLCRVHVIMSSCFMMNYKCTIYLYWKPLTSCRIRITWSLQSKNATHILCFHLGSIWRILHARVALSNSTSEGSFAAPSFLKQDLGQWSILPFFNLSM